MKHFAAPALVLAIVAVFVMGRSVIVTAQQPGSLPPAISPVALPVPAAPQLAPPTPNGDFAFPVQPLTPPVAAAQPLTVATLNDLVRALKEVRQKKAELQQEEEKLTAAIRQKIEQEKKVHEEVLQMLGTATREEPKVKVEVESTKERRGEPDTVTSLPK